MEGIKGDKGNCLLKMSAVKRARWKSLLVSDKERENREKAMESVQIKFKTLTKEAIKKHITDKN